MRIESLIPEAGKADENALRGVDAGALARYVIDTRNPWWRRRPCARALRDRVPAELVAGLLDRIRDAADTSEVRIALLDVLADRAELLPWLQAQSDERYGMQEAILKTRGALGDLSAASELATLAADAWTHRRITGELGLDLLVERHGLAAVTSAVGDARPEDRVFQIRMQSRAGGDVIAAFADPDVGVARTACELVIKTGVPDDETLIDHVVTGPTTEARLWAAYALHRGGRDVRELWHAIDAPRVEVAGLPADIRAAILREYPGEWRSDPRWLVERACADLGAAPDVEAQLAHAVAALAAAGLAPQPPKPIGKVNGQGDGTFHVIEFAGGAVYVSTLGAYACSDKNHDESRHAMERAGFRWIDGELGAIVVTGLGVYYFGDRAPLDVRTLLFYWQD